MDGMLLVWPDTALTIIGLPVRDLVIIGMVSLLALVLSGLVLWRAQRLRILGIALAWTALAALPSIVALPFPYITVSQRLLYSSGPAAAVLWATVCVSLAGRARSAGIRVALAAGLACAVAAVPVLYVQREMTLHEIALRPTEEMAEIARQYPDKQHLVVNAVNWLNYKQPWYGLGQEGVSVSADYVDFERLIEINSGNQALFAAATYPAIKVELAQHYYSTINEETPWDAAMLTETADEFDRIWLTVYRDDATHVLAAGAVRSAPDTKAPEYLANFGEKAYLLDATLEVLGQTAIASLHWKYSADLDSITVFRHLYDCAGQLIGQGDGHPLAGMLSWGGLAPGTEIDDIRHIPLEDVPDDGCYVLGIGLYTTDGQRIPVWNSDGVILPDATVSRTFVQGRDP